MTTKKRGHLSWHELGHPKTLKVRVSPKASRNEVCLDTQENGSVRLRVYVTTVPEDGKANKAVLTLLAKALCLPKSSLEIIQGHTTRDKVVLVDAPVPNEPSSHHSLMLSL